MPTMTDSIKHFTGFDISGKNETEYLKRQEVWELTWINHGKGKLIDEIFGAKCEGNIFNPLLSRIIKRCHHFASNTEIIQTYRTF
jgi:hypothetical protein